MISNAVSSVCHGVNFAYVEQKRQREQQDFLQIKGQGFFLRRQTDVLK